MFVMTVLVKFIIFSILCFRGGDSADEYGVLSKSDIFSKIRTALEVEKGGGSATDFSVEDVKWLLKRLRFKDCGKDEKSKCNLCVGSNEFMKWYGHGKSTTITQKIFGQYSEGILHILTKDKAKEKSCHDFTKEVLKSKSSSSADSLLQKYAGGKGKTLDEGAVKKIGDDIGKLYGSELKSKCFAAPAGSNGTVTYASLYTVMKMMDTDCLPYDPTIDEKSVNKVFTKFQKVYSDAVLKKLNQSAQCYTRPELEGSMNLNKDKSVLSKRTTSDVTPEFIKLMSNINSSHHNDHHGGKGEKPTWQPWIASFFSIAVISFGSLVGILAFKGKQRKYFHHVMSFLVSMGSSVLICDALLHLIPHSLHFHGSLDGSHFNIDSWLWKCLMILIGIYLFIMMELTLKVFGFGHSHSHGGHDAVENGVENHNLLEIKDNITEAKAVAASRDNDTPFTLKSIKSVAWMILVGDGVHNFMDGVAIGGVFSEPFPAGLNGGIMTSIAIFIHEVPHELGDFAVLISSGLSLKQALILNLLSSLTAFAGGIVGIVLGTHWAASPWIFALTGGLFIYISLVDMLPEVHNSPLLKISPKLALLLDFCGMTFGLLIMFLIAGYEAKIENALLSGPHRGHHH